MKTLAAFAALLFAASQLSAQNPPAANPADAKPADPKSTPTVKTPVKKDDVNKPAPEPVIPGLTIARTNGTFLGLEVVGGNFKLSFYDQKKKLMAPDITQASARWPNLQRAVAGDNRTVLNPSGNALVGSKHVDPPLTFNVYLTLLQGEGDEAKAVENYTVQFHG
jgi:hypothetical protein